MIPMYQVQHVFIARKSVAKLYLNCSNDTPVHLISQLYISNPLERPKN